MVQDYLRAGSVLPSGGAAEARARTSAAAETEAALAFQAEWRLAVTEEERLGRK